MVDSMVKNGIDLVKFTQNNDTLKQKDKYPLVSIIIVSFNDTEYLKI
ncbi:MAG: hypothetical protein ACTSRZ_14355 [Promethearchaeota archaeon]